MSVAVFDRDYLSKLVPQQEKKYQFNFNESFLFFVVSRRPQKNKKSRCYFITYLPKSAAVSHPPLLHAVLFLSFFQHLDVQLCRGFALAL